MTQREFFTAVMNQEITAETIEFAKAQIDKLDAKAVADAEKRAEKNKANAPMIAVIASHLKADAPLLASEARDFVNAEVEGLEDEISTSKASALLRAMVAEGIAVVEDVKNGSRSVKGYKLA